jgi:hypothetical protein
MMFLFLFIQWEKPFKAIKIGHEKAGIIGNTQGKFSSEVILSQCPHWCRLDHLDALWLKNKLSEFYQIFQDNGYLPEEAFELLHDRQGIDNCPPVTGKALNDCVCNRQRCLILGNNMLQVHQEFNRAQKKKSKPKGIMCMLCAKPKPRRTIWIKCQAEGCTFYCCGAEICTNTLSTHELYHRNL